MWGKTGDAWDCIFAFEREHNDYVWSRDINGLSFAFISCQLYSFMDMIYAILITAAYFR